MNVLVIVRHMLQQDNLLESALTIEHQLTMIIINF